MEGGEKRRRRVEEKGKKDKEMKEKKRWTVCIGGLDRARKKQTGGEWERREVGVEDKRREKKENDRVIQTSRVNIS